MSVYFMFIEWIFEGSNENELFAFEVDLEKLLKVLGFAYVFETG